MNGMSRQSKENCACKNYILRFTYCREIRPGVECLTVNICPLCRKQNAENIKGTKLFLASVTHHPKTADSLSETLFTRSSQ